MKTINIVGKYNDMVITISSNTYEEAYLNALETLQSENIRFEEVEDE